MSWRGPELLSEQQDVLNLVSALGEDHAPVVEDDVDQVRALRRELVALGLWTAGASESVGGGGADHRTTAVVLERLGRHWPAIGLASAHAHAALDLLDSWGSDQGQELVEQLLAGLAGIAVVDARREMARAWRIGLDTGTGRIPRVDAATPAPHLLIIVGDARAVLVSPEQVEWSALRRSGLGGAFTRMAVLHGSTMTVMDEVEAARSLTRLRLGAAAVACGIAGAAADASAEYASGREQFGSALTALPTMRRSLLEQDLLVRRSLLLACADSQGELHALEAVVQACDAAVEVAASSIQVHGGYGYLTEYPVARHLCDAVSLSAALDVQSLSSVAARVNTGMFAVRQGR